MLSLIYIYPFRCQLCGRRFFSLHWGIRYHRAPVTPGEVDYREYHRYPVQIPVVLYGRHGEFRGRTSDLSLGGCTLVASGPCRDISGLNVRLLLPCEPRPVVMDEAAVRTVHSRRIGMEFLLATPEDKARLGRFIETMAKRSVPDYGARPSRPVPSPPVASMASPPNSSSFDTIGKR